MFHYSQRPHHLLILSIVITFHPNLLNSSTPTCSPFTCGNYTVDYPFWRSDTGPDYPFWRSDTSPDSFCGYPGFGLSCTSHRPILKLSTDSYYVTQISYTQHTLTLLDINLADNACPRPRHNVSLDLNIDSTHFRPLLNHSYPDSNLTFFFSCHSTPSSVGLIQCLSSEGSWAFVYRGGDEEIARYDWNRRCNESVVVPVEEERGGERFSGGGFVGVVQRGFEVGWFVSGDCGDCEGLGGYCGYATSNGTERMTCYCLNGTVSDRCKQFVRNNSTQGVNSTENGVDSRGAASTQRGQSVEERTTRPMGSILRKVEWIPVGAASTQQGISVEDFFNTVEDENICLKSDIEISLAGTVSGAIVLLLACIVFVFFIRKSVKRTNDSQNNATAFSLRQRPVKNVEAFLQSYGSLVPKRYRYLELKKITNSFKDKLGEGGYGGVFKGKLKDGRLVAVKVLNNSKGNGEEFINEVASIGRTYHVNIVTLLGFCYEGSKRALIYEFMSNGSLEKFIYSNKLEGAQRALTCERLFEIAVGIARGLEYLHRGCSMRILHFDIKPHNILLDDEFCPKISDFGLAKLCPKHESIISMQDARGTTGYIAPEVYCRNIGGVSHKSDVYSYGMMVLEMVGGRKNIDAQAQNTSEIYFPHWVYNHIALEDSFELIGILEEEEKEIARKMVLVGLWCIQTNPTNRPSMSKVVEMLEGSVQGLEMPPKPYLSSP
ncbi:LEAF RUST 10 DISEASE-RESISTANCE LOCUS RECEPTOR-LIKE PROTEIN KINASE-like protein 2.1 [Cinnamomum micranthum f. kanehirae]|uniref:LEAF RUST 10 DISEASE-RESISTANCE LOCUS RECEPTOR-LIKE PROTEIN KINASE-like protein 2.1 n=1 Tax=Cinnamomum micranthum f. kanehirae TaxID=337451 RepID=A0A3S3M2T3_9MAGN|nr:LEAF RUST 10 DISEASE-RESISTANCE LOCUS RECEPTOR-LIKE PROTEIN KINASE-like protein 2.1 [Cinnamomum micranthum f. kanehirae]